MINHTKLKRLAVLPVSRSFIIDSRNKKEVITELGVINW